MYFSRMKHNDYHVLFANDNFQLSGVCHVEQQLSFRAWLICDGLPATRPQ